MKQLSNKEIYEIYGLVMGQPVHFLEKKHVRNFAREIIKAHEKKKGAE